MRSSPPARLPRLAPPALPLVALALALALPAHQAVAADTVAQSAALSYALSAGPLEDVLSRFAAQTGTPLSFDPALVAGKHSEGLHGPYSVAAGFAALLAGSGLEAVPGNSGSADGGDRNYTLRKRLQDGAAATLPTVNVAAGALLGGDASRTENTGTYTAQAISAGSKQEQSLREIPRSISVMTRQQLDDQQITALDAAMEQLPGVTLIPGSGYNASAYYTRGYQITSFLVDGAPAAAYNSNDTTLNAGMARYDSVQLLRGPDAMFSGNGAPSGSVNLVRKKPLSAFQFKTNLSAGRWNNLLADADLTGPLTASGHLRGRLVAAHNDREYFFDGAHRKLSSLYGVIDLDLGPRTLLSLGISHDRERGSGRGTPPGFPRYANGVPLPVPRSQGYTRWSFSESDSTQVFATLEHAFNDRWQGRLNLSHTDSSLASNVSSYVGQADPLTGLGSQIYPGTWAEGDFRTHAADAYLSGDFDWLGRRHRIVVGADYRDSRAQLDQFGGTASATSITDWSHVDPDALIPSNARGTPNWISATETRQTGLYANGKFQLLGPLSLVLGGRYATYRNINNSRTPSAPSAPLISNKSDDIFTPYYALTFDFSERWTGFFTVAESYQDQSNYYTASHKPLDPTTGQSFELGLKGELMNGRLNANATLYRSKRDNFAVRESVATDFDVPGRSCCWRGDGEFLAQGVELDLSGELAPGWQINAGYTFDDNKTEYGDNKGERYASYTPKHILRLWSAFQLRGDLSAWKVGGGMKTQSGFFRSGTVTTWNPTGGKDGSGAFDGPAEAYKFREPGRAIWNAFVEYRIDKHWSAALNVDNLFDKRYFQSVGDTRNWYGDGSFYGEPRNLRLTLRGSF